ncbi:MAG TPA: hypothetical protein EYQ66_07575 [Myxococcales bacterium]|nr:hypothetical protein [Myxococcales bacterium]
MSEAPDRRERPDLVPPPVSFWTGIVSRAEVWIYELNESGHWFFGFYDWCNEIWARLAFRSVRERASRLDEPLAGKDITARMRMLGSEDLEDFVALLETLDQHKYLPPHRLDRSGARAALERASYLPFGVFDEERLVGYWLVRLFFPRRAATGVWMLSEYFDSGLGTRGVFTTGTFTTGEGFADYITVPLDNTASLRGAVTAGWRVVRKNHRFYVLVRD